MDNNIINNLREVQQSIPPNVVLIAVTKTVSVDNIKVAYNLGIRDFAENKLQEALNKQDLLQDFPDIRWHFIGHLQTNKAKKAIESFSWIHSVDSLKLAQKLDFHCQQALAEGLISHLPQICLQVKMLTDNNKYGWYVDELYKDLPSLQELKFLHFRGLMTILPLNLSSLEILTAFESTQKLCSNLRQNNYFSSDFNQLSMGMSGDYPLAIEAGATMIRLGTIIFGDRKQNN